MQQSQRIGLVLVAVVLVVGGFIVARGSSSDSSTTAAGSPSTSTVALQTTTTVARAPAGGTVTKTVTHPASTTTTARAKPAPPAAPVVLVRGGKPSGGIKKLSFKGGNEIRFTVSSDVADEIHVHGYDLKKDVKAGGKVSFAFKGDIEGVFEVELENAGVQIASLKVAQ